MQNRIRSFLLTPLLLLGAVFVLISCGNGGSGGASNGSATSGSLAYLPSSAVSVVAGASYDLTLDLVNSSGVSGQVVNLAVSDPSIATVSPSTCTLSSGSIASSECNLKIRGVASGSTTLVASSSAYSNLSIAITTVTNPGPPNPAVNYGALAVQNGYTDGAQYVSTTPVALNYATGGNQITINAKLAGSSNVTGSTTISFAPSAGTATPVSCSVTSTNPFCQTVVSGLPGNGATPITVSASSTLGAGKTYSSITVNATSSASGPSNGAVVIGTQNQHTGNQVPVGMKAPIFINLASNGKADNATVTLTLTNSDGSPWTTSSAFSLYSYNAPNNSQLYQWGGTASSASSSPAGGTAFTTCTLSSSASSCGYGVVANRSTGSVIVSGTVVSANGYTYSIEPLALSAIPVNASDVARSVVFTNNSTQDIWVAITGGAAASFISPTIPAGSVATGKGSVTAVGANTCGPSAPQNACPMGSSCMQGGAVPGSATPFYCYWDQGTPSPGYAIASGGNKTTLNISRYSLQPGTSPIIWSGNFSPRQGCNPVTGVCTNAGCAGIAGGLACGPGAGPSPGINTLAELTFQESPTVTDYYDVSVIGGANFATQFGPTSGQSLNTVASNQYTCGTPGSTTNLPTAGGAGYVANSLATLPMASWTMGATSASFPPGNSITNSLAPSYFRVVSGGTGASCSGSGTCTTAGEVCGYNGFAAIGKTPSYNTQVCGQQLTWVSANQVWSQNQTSTNTAPFSFATNTGANSVGNYQLCTGSTFSAYNPAGTTPVSAACGGVMWGTGQTGQTFNNAIWNSPVNDGITSPVLNITQPSTPLNYASINWLTYVLPTIQWLKAACPTCYTYPFDDKSSTFKCSNNTNSINYGVSFSDLK